MNFRVWICWGFSFRSLGNGRVVVALTVNANSCGKGLREKIVSLSWITWFPYNSSLCKTGLDEINVIKTNANIKASCVTSGTKELLSAASPSCYLPAAPDWVSPWAGGSVTQAGIWVWKEQWFGLLGTSGVAWVLYRCYESSWSCEFNRLWCQRRIVAPSDPLAVHFCFFFILGNSQPGGKKST